MNDLSYEFDTTSLLTALKQMNRAFQDFEKTAGTAATNLSEKYSNVYDKLIKVTDRGRQAQERYVRSIEQTAAAYGKSGADKLIAQRDTIIKRLGDEQKAVDRVRAAYEKMIDVEKKRGGGSSGHGGGAGVNTLRGIRDLFEGRTAYGEVQIGKAIGSLSGLPLLLGGATAAFAGLAVASHAAAESLAKYAVQIEDVKLRTGLSTREVAEFSFAAKAVGQDISITERMMRGLSEAMLDNTPAGTRARETMHDLGVTITDLSGNLRPTGELLKDISEGFAKLPPGVVQSREAMELFKRVGVEAIPFMRELKENTDYFNAHGVPSPNDADLAKWKSYNKQLEASSEIWASIWRDFNSVMAEKWMHVTNILFPPNPAKSSMSASTTKELAQEAEERKVASMGGELAITSAASGLKSYLNDGGGLESEERKLSRLRKAYDDSRSNAEKMADSGRLDPNVASEQHQLVELARVEFEKQRDVVKEINKLESQRVSNAEALVKLQSQAGERAAHPFGMLPAERQLMEFSSHPGMGRGQIGSAQSALRTQPDQEVDDILRKSGLKRSSLREGHDDGPFSYLGMTNLPFSSSIGRDALQIRSAQFSGGFVGANMDIFAQEHTRLAASGKLMELRKKEEDTYSRDFIRSGEGVLSESRKGSEEAGLSSIRLRSTLAANTPENRLAAERAILDIKKQSAKEEYDAAKAKISDEYGDATVRENAYKELRLRNTREIAAAEAEYAEQRAGEARKQLDSIKSASESLLHTLFTAPRGFGRQLGTTLRDAALKPIESGMSEQIARVLYAPVSSIGGTLRGAFGGSGGINNVQLIGGAVPVHIVGSGGSAATSGGGGGGFSGGADRIMGGFGGSSGGGGGFGGFGGGTDGGGGFGGGGMGGGIGAIGPGGTSGFAGPLAGFGGIGKGLGGMFGNLKGAFWNENINRGGYTQAAGSMGAAGKFAGVATSPGAAAAYIGVGMPLASAGLLGNRRGTLTGIAESGIGGALIGAGIGTMIMPGIGTLIGAGIGAAAGTLAGIGEKLFGVESDRNHVIKLVKQAYGLAINNSIADQIVGLAKQKYGGQMSTAVRAPEVREMLGLFAAGSGQRMPQSAMSPHGASLVESGGQLFQGNQYQYGNKMSYQSNLPIYGGGGGANLPNPGGSGPTMVSLNIGSGNVAGFMTGQFVTPEFVAGQQASAYRSSVGRMESAMSLQDPGSIVS